MAVPATHVSFPYSDLLRQPKSVLAFIDQGEVVELVRRDGPNLRIELADRAADVEEAVVLAARILRATLHETATRGVLERVFGEVFPWIELLPDDEQVECVEALLRRLRAGAEAGVLAPFTQLVHEWRQTAALHADPRLSADLTRPLPGDGPLRPPTRVTTPATDPQVAEFCTPTQRSSMARCRHSDTAARINVDDPETGTFRD